MSKKKAAVTPTKVFQDGTVNVSLKWPDGKIQEIQADAIRANLVIDDVIGRNSQDGTCKENEQFFNDLHQEFTARGILPSNATYSHAYFFYREVTAVFEELKKNMS